MSTIPEPAHGDYNRAGELDALAWTWSILAGIFVSMRIYSRLRLTHNMWWDDYVMILTMLLMIAYTICWTVLGANSGSRHLFYLTPQQALSASRLNWITQPVIITALASGKISVALLILRIMARSCWRRMFLYVSMVGTFLFCWLGVVVTFIQCRPVQALWDPKLLQTGQATCWKPEAHSNISIFVGSWLAFMDVALAAVAISIIVELQLPLRKKVPLCCLFGLGVFAAICACIKTAKLPLLNARSDLTWQTVDLWIWNANECGVVVIGACIPTLRPLFLIIFRRPGRHVYLNEHQQGRAYVHGGRKGYLRSQSKEQGREATYDSRTAIGVVSLKSGEENWLEMGTKNGENLDIRQDIDVSIERRDKIGEEDDHKVGGGRAETTIVGGRDVVRIPNEESTAGAHNV